MSVLSGKKILLGLSASIAAYKTPLLVRYFVKSGAKVRVVMTPSARNFVTPLTLSTLSQHPVYAAFTNDDDGAVWNNHVDLALWADLFVIAPATANTLSKMAIGSCDNLLLATYLSAKCPVYFAPAMDLDMYRHPTTISTLEKLSQFGNTIIPATNGPLASGLVGEGRMAEPEDIAAFVEKDLTDQLPLKGKKVLVTAGPTYEAIDPIRFMSNHSSGKMGFEIAKASAALGAEVTLVTGPTHQSVTHALINTVPVVSANDMYTAARAVFNNVDIAIFAAAVADFKPQKPAHTKIKKGTSAPVIALEKTKDILETLSKIKKKQYLVGFALETNNGLENAKEKRKQKHLDLIVLNTLSDRGAGFGGDTNKVTFIDNNDVITAHPLKTKALVAKDLMNKIIEKIYA